MQQDQYYIVLGNGQAAEENLAETAYTDLAKWADMTDASEACVVARREACANRPALALRCGMGTITSYSPS